jgi:hypothetical protein
VRIREWAGSRLTEPGSMREHYRSKRLSRRRGGKLRLQSSRSLAKRCGHEEFKPDTWCRGAYGDHDFCAPQTPLSKMRTYRYMTSAPGSGNSEMRIYLTSVPGTVAGFQANWFLTNKPTIPPFDQPRRERNRVIVFRLRAVSADVDQVQLTSGAFKKISEMSQD